MKYESNILKRLIDTYGVIGNPRYLSEIIKEFIVRGKELYPQLFTYQADWLAHIDEFGLTPDYVVSYTGQQIYAPHTKERPVKRAILKGETLVNLMNENESFSASLDGTNPNYWAYKYFTLNQNLKPNTNYTLIFKANISQSHLIYIGGKTGNAFNSTSLSNVVNGVNKFLITTCSDITDREMNKLFIQTNNSNVVEITLNEFILIEGDHTNEDIPYFTGMQSVKMPVLTTTGKNLFDIENTGFLAKTNINGQTMYRIPNDASKGFILNHNKLPNIKVSLNYYKEGGDDSSFGRYVYTDGTEEYIHPDTLTSDASKSIYAIHFYDWVLGRTVYVSNVMVSEDVATYEPYKSNILTVNEEVELRGIGDVRDTLDLMTGEVTQRISEVVIDGSENFVYPAPNVYRVLVPDIHLQIDSIFVCDTMPTTSWENYSDESYDGYVYQTREGFNFIQFKRTEEEFKEFLQKNPITIQYQLAEKSIKTVDLTIKDQNDFEVSQLSSFNGGTHFSTSSQEGSLLPTIIVDVVTDLEETLNLCSMDGNTL